MAHCRRISESRLLNLPALAPLREELILAALAYYKDFVRDNAGNPELRWELVATQFRVGQIGADGVCRPCPLPGHHRAIPRHAAWDRR